MSRPEDPAVLRPSAASLRVRGSQPYGSTFGGGQRRGGEAARELPGVGGLHQDASNSGALRPGSRRNQSTSRSSQSSPPLALSVLVGVVIGYAAFGKTFSYVGVAPIYVGEVTLLAVTLLLLVSGGLSFRGFRGLSIRLACGLGLVQLTLQIIGGTQASEALRNFSVLYYVWFAGLAYSAVRHPRWACAEPNPRMLGSIGTCILLGLATSSLLSFVLGSKLPVIPGAGVPLFSFKPTDAGVILLALLVLWLRQAMPSWTVVLIAPLLIVSIAVSRSTLLCALAVLVLVCRSSRRLFQLSALLAAALLLLTLTGASFVVNNREVSVRQIQANALSAIGIRANPDLAPVLNDNVNFRLNWWHAIVSDASSVNHVLEGDAWATNLADKYGFQTSVVGGGQSALRHPHNVFFGLLGRAGWLVATFYVWFLLSFTSRVLFTIRRLPGSAASRILLLEVVAVVCIAGIVNGSTDVYLESPQNAIPFWVMVGVGAAFMGKRLVAPEERQG